MTFSDQDTRHIVLYIHCNKQMTRVTLPVEDKVENRSRVILATKRGYMSQFEATQYEEMPLCVI